VSDKTYTVRAEYESAHERHTVMLTDLDWERALRWIEEHLLAGAEVISYETRHG
jgi:hypothetical protein